MVDKHTVLHLSWVIKLDALEQHPRTVTRLTPEHAMACILETLNRRDSR